jgi:hypothetical protein
MAEPERNYLLELWDNNVCPNCGKKIPAGKRVGSGKKSDGGFLQSRLLRRVLQG